MLQHFLQALTHIASATLTQSVMAKVVGQLPVDTRLSSQDIQQLNLMTAEIHKVFYDWLVRSYGDNSWRSVPNVDIANLLSGQSPIGVLLKQLIEKFIGTNSSIGGTPPKIL
jgi:hypothetical protein